MRSRCVVFLLAALLSASSVLAVPPHPQLLQRIDNGLAPEPIFMSNPGYRGEMGIDQGLTRPLFDQAIGLTNVNFLAVLVGFSDLPGVSPPVYFDSMVFGTQPAMWGPTLRGFYNRASYGNLTIVTVNYPSGMGWRTASNNRSYYTSQGGTNSYGMGTYPNNSQGLCEWVVANIDPIVNFANYDNNSDGFVDGIIMIHAGKGAEVSGDTLDIWSHAWSISPQVRDGVNISSYCVTPEYWNSPQDMTIGVMCHEFGHVLGLPDFYDYGYDSYGLGEWSLMAYGSWNGNGGWGTSPAFLDAWSRVFLGFVTPVNVTCNIAPANIPAVEDSARVYRLWTLGATGNQYYLIEYRERSYTDTALAASGVTIYHVDDNQFGNDNQWWPGLPPASHYRVALEQADNSYHLEHYVNSMDASDPYPGLMWNTSFTDNTFPSARDYFGAATQVSVTNIALPFPGMAMANLGVGMSGGTPGPLVIWWPLNGEAFSFDDVAFGWQTDPMALAYHIQIDNDISFSSPLVNDSTWPNNIYNYSFAGHPDGPYYWRARGIGCSGGPWSSTQRISRDTQPPYGCVASSPATAYSTSFTVSWSAATDPPPSCGIMNYTVMCDSGTGWYGLIQTLNLSTTFVGARDGQTYRFAAFAQDSAANVEYWGGQAECSTYVNLSGGIPGAPVLLFPTNGSASSLAMQTFSWVNDPVASFYHIQIDNNSDLSSPIYNDSTITVNNLGFSFSSYSDGIYYWRVRGRGTGGTGPWSDVWNVFIDRQLPSGSVASSPDTSHSSSFLVSWTTGTDPAPSSGICSYNVWCDSGAGPAFGWLFGYSGNSATFTGARNGNKYYFTACALDCAQNLELYSFPPFECSTYVDISGGCAYIVGDINGNGATNGIDVTYGVIYFKGGAPPPVDCGGICPETSPFYAAGDVNGNCVFNGIDISFFVNYLKGISPALLSCGDCPPASTIAVERKMEQNQAR